MTSKLIYIIISISIVFASGGYDNGTAIKKNKFKLDLTWNPFDKLSYGQTYAILRYGITDKFNFQGYISRHPGNYSTWYSGIFYQFYKSSKLNLSTAIGIRKRFDKEWTHLFFPQLLYTYNLNNEWSIGGSFVQILDRSEKINYGSTVDITLLHKLKYQSNIIESISIGIGGFHPVTWKSKYYFTPTYSIDIKFK